MVNNHNNTTNDTEHGHARTGTDRAAVLFLESHGIPGENRSLTYNGDSDGTHVYHVTTEVVGDLYRYSITRNGNTVCVSYYSDKTRATVRVWTGGNN